jgi:methylated-DNA-[protein]-cysteine S-methyltransferase
MKFHARSIDSPFGPIRLVATDDALVGVYLPVQRPTRPLELEQATSHPVLDRAAGQFQEYFQGERTGFSVPLAQPGTPFQQSVWAALLTIPFGAQRSYTWLAQQVGRPRAVRAVGAANGRNVLPIIVPCHRVVGRDGSLVGYGGGVEVKRWLLEHERFMAERLLAASS